MNKNMNMKMRRRMIQLFSLVATTFLMTLTRSTAYVTVHPASSLSSPFSLTKGTGIHKRSKMYASKNSEDSSATPTDTLPRLSSIFKGKDGLSENVEDDSRSFSYSTQQRKITAKFSNRDVDIDNFSSAPSDTDTNNESLLFATATVVAMTSVLFWYSSQENFAVSFPILDTGSSLVESVKEVMADPGGALEHVVELTESMGTLGIAYFGVAYCIAEILAVPAIPLTASAGYLFGPLKGTAIVLLSASIAAAVSFQIGRTLLRDYVENLLKDYPKFAKIDKAIGREGFKLMFLLRLSPIFPFALSNYLYGASSINFPAFFGGTLLGFAPGTFAYVYTGYVGKALTGDAGSDVYPWYVYLGGLSLFAGLLKVIADTATRVVEEIEAEDN